MRNKKKNIFSTILISCFSLFFAIKTTAQVTATYVLTSNKAALVAGVQFASVAAGDMLPGATFDPLGSHNTDGYKCAIASGNWPTVATDGHSLDFPISPLAGNDLTISGLTLTAKTSGSSGSNLLSLAYQTDGAGPWTSMGTVQTANSGGTTSVNFGALSNTFPDGHTYIIRMYVYASGTTTSSRKLYIKNVAFSGTTISSPLPVVLSKFSVNCNQLNQTIIKWTAQTETGILKYEIENSIDGIFFKSIKNIDPKNNQNGTVSYEYIHNETQASAIFYRLKIVNLNGEVKFSSIQKSLCAQKNELASITPNPVVNKTVNLKLERYTPGYYTILIINENGQIVQRDIRQLNDGVETLQIKMSAIASPGNYILKVIGSLKSTIIKFTL